MGMHTSRQSQMEAPISAWPSPLGFAAAAAVVIVVSVVAVVVVVVVVVMVCEGQATQDKAEYTGSPFEDCPFTGFHVGFPLVVKPTC